MMFVQMSVPASLAITARACMCSVTPDWMCWGCEGLALLTTYRLTCRFKCDLSVLGHLALNLLSL